MKTRTGFVSNSSSSSFIVACNDELCSCMLKKALKINHPLGFVTDALAHFIENNSQHIDIKDWEKDCYQKPPKEVVELAKKFKHLYKMDASSHEGGEVAGMLYDHAKEFEVVTKDIEIHCLYETD